MTAPALPDLTPNELAFISELLLQKKHDATAAYLRVFGCARSTAKANGGKMYRKDNVQAEIKKRRAQAVKEAGLDHADILRELHAVVTADPRELMEYRRGACRFCHGFEHRYQFTPNEYRQAKEDYLLRNQQAHDKSAGRVALDPLGALFDVRGGVGFNPTEKPHKRCPECFGQGVGYSYVKDSRTVSAAAARLFVAVKETKDGVEIKTRSTDKSVELMMRHLGMLDAGNAGDKKTPAQLAAEIQALMQQAGATIGGPG